MKKMMAVVVAGAMLILGATTVWADVNRGVEVWFTARTSDGIEIGTSDNSIRPNEFQMSPDGAAEFVSNGVWLSHRTDAQGCVRVYPNNGKFSRINVSMQNRSLGPNSLEILVMTDWGLKKYYLGDSGMIDLDGRYAIDHVTLKAAGWGDYFIPRITLYR